MTYFLKSGTTFRVSSKEAMDLHEKLPVGNYVIKKDEMSGQLFLESINSFEIKGKQYGDLTKNTGRIMNTFLDRPATTGVMLTGEKGSGKSLLAKAVSIAAYAQQIPTIVINAAWCGDKFNSFIQSIEQPCIILFDEFEKVYDRDSQEQILTLLDGVFPSKKLFMLTCNDKYRVDTHMRNRPGRIYYMIDFKGLTADFIIEYCTDNLKAKNHIDKIVQIANLFTEFNFDMLKALVEEMNRYNESPEVALKMLNAKPEFDNGTAKYTVDLSIAGIPVDRDHLNKQQWQGNPLNGQIHIDYKEYEKEKALADICDSSPSLVGEDYEWFDIGFTSADLKKIDSQTGKFIFVDEENNSLILTKVEEKKSYLYDAL